MTAEELAALAVHAHRAAARAPIACHRRSYTQPLAAQHDSRPARRRHCAPRSSRTSRCCSRPAARGRHQQLRCSSRRSSPLGARMADALSARPDQPAWATWLLGALALVARRGAAARALAPPPPPPNGSRRPRGGRATRRPRPSKRREPPAARTPPPPPRRPWRTCSEAAASHRTPRAGSRSGAVRVALAAIGRPLRRSDGPLPALSLTARLRRWSAQRAASRLRRVRVTAPVGLMLRRRQAGRRRTPRAPPAPEPIRPRDAPRFEQSAAGRSARHGAVDPFRRAVGGTPVLACGGAMGEGWRRRRRRRRPGRQAR